MLRPSVLDGGRSSTFDLTPLSEANYIRHRFKRYLVGVAGCAAFVALLALGIAGIFVAVSSLPVYERYFFATVGALIGYLCLSLAWIPFRYWAVPPVAMTVSSNGLDFLFRSGSRILVPWERNSLRIELLERVMPHKHAPEAAYRIWVMWGRGDFEFVWRRVVPLVYTSEGGLQRVLEEARTRRLSVRRVDRAKALSLVPTVSRTAYIVSRDAA